TPIASAIPAAVHLPSFQIQLGDDPATGPYFTDRAAETDLNFAIPGPDVTLRFQPPLGAPAVQLRGPWSVLVLLTRPGAFIDEAADPSGRTVTVPLRFTDQTGTRFYYWLSLRFTRPPPALAEWPTMGDWPS